MPRAPLLEDDAIDARLATLKGWARDGARITKCWRFGTFRDALDFLLVVADEADAQDHHPDVAIHWNELTLTLWTHASGGLTERDFRLAETIDRIMEP